MSDDFDKLLAEVESDPASAALLEAGRKWVRDTFYGGSMTLDDVMDKVAAFAVSVARLSHDATNEAQDQAFEVRDEIRAAILAFAAEQVAQYKQDAERYRWLRYQHQIINPRAALMWEKDGAWFNTADLDGSIDAAIRARAQEE